MISRAAATLFVMLPVIGPAAGFQLDEPCHIMTRGEIEAKLIEFGMKRSEPGVFRTFQPSYANRNWRDLLARLEERMFLLAY